MRRPMWRRLDLTEEEWLECQRSAAEMALATRTHVSARQVAVEYALARGSEEAVAPGLPAYERAHVPTVRSGLTN